MGFGVKAVCGSESLVCRRLLCESCKRQNDVEETLVGRGLLCENCMRQETLVDVVLIVQLNTVDARACV